MKLDNVLITGGTGTFGEAFALRCLKSHIHRVCIYSRDEYKQAEMRLKVTDDRLRWFIGDVRDKERLRRALEGVEIVIHSAALKRVEVGEYNADEMVKTNVLGTMNLIEACHEAGVSKVIGLSTDKAEEPINAYGASKLLMEKLLMAANNSAGDMGPQFSVVRCGNFFGSRGSVLEIWKAAIARGERVPLTDEKCTRFLMTVEEAVEIVMGVIDKMPLLTVPKLRAFAPVDLSIALHSQYYLTGLRDWEKLHEIMDGKSSEDASRLNVTELKELCFDTE